MDLKLKVCPEREGIKQEREYVSHKEESGRMTIDRERRSGHTQKRHTEWASSHQAREKTCNFLELEVPWNHILVSVFLRHYGWNSLRVHCSHCYVCPPTYNTSQDSNSPYGVSIPCNRKGWPQTPFLKQFLTHQ